MASASGTSTSTSTATPSSAINSSNIGFQLLKKQGWKEGSGLGVSLQGRLEPVETHPKYNKRGLGAPVSRPKRHPTPTKTSQKEKALSMRIKKLADEEKRLQEKEFQLSFFREFWPDNV